VNGKRKGRLRHSQPPPSPRGPRLEEIIEEANALRQEGKFEEALEVLESAPLHLQRRLELLTLRGSLHVALEEINQATELFEEAQRVAPDHPLVASFLADLYYKQDWKAHCARAARQALRYADSLSSEMRKEMRAILEEMETFFREVAAKGKIRPERMEEAYYQAERAERQSRAGRFEEAARLYRRVIRMVPTWLAPYNNEALFLFHSGQVERAIRISEGVLEAHPDNLHALANLVHFHLARGEREKAEEYAARLKHLPMEFPDDADKVIEALGFLGDDKGLYAIYHRYRPFIEELNAYSLLVLGSAAANLGHPRVARRLWWLAEEAGAPHAAIAPLLIALTRHAPGPGSAQRYPTVSLPQLIPTVRLEALVDLLSAWERGEMSEKAKEKRIKELLKRTPHLLDAVVKLLWEEDDPRPAIQALALIGTPEAVEEIQRFAFGQVGEMRHRLAALETLVDLGVVDVDQPVRVWNEEAQEWGEVRVFPLEITTEVEPPPYEEEVWDHIAAGVEALHEGRLEEARKELEAAIALNPQAAIAHHNLAVVLRGMGDLEAAFGHLKKAVEIVPDYPHGCCTLAHYFIDQGDLEKAQKVILPLTERRRFHPEEWIYYQRTLARLMLEMGNYNAAQEHARNVLDMDPEDEGANVLLTRAQALEVAQSPHWKEMRRRAREREEKKRHRPTRLDAGLVECLERLTKEALIGTARAMPVPRKHNVRKAVLIQDLAEYLTRPEVLKEIVQGLSDEERQALRDVLKAGGTMDWEGFTARYGDDLDESPYWDWREPETVMGRLRMLGLLSEGTVDDQLVVLIPYELRDLLPPLLEKTR